MQTENERCSDTPDTYTDGSVYYPQHPTLSLGGFAAWRPGEAWRHGMGEDASDDQDVPLGGDGWRYAGGWRGGRG